LLAEWDSAEDELRQRFTLHRGRVAIAAMPSFAGNRLPAMLKHFRARYPSISVTVHDVINEQVIEMVRNRQVELGIAFEPEGTAMLNFKPLYLDRFVAVVPPTSALADSTSLTWEDLEPHPFIALQRPSYVRFMLEERLSANSHALNVSLESHQLATIGRMVGSGLGVSIVPALCIQQMHELGARCITLCDPIIERSVGILSKSDHELSVAAQAIFDIMNDFNG